MGMDQLQTNTRKFLEVIDIFIIFIWQRFQRFDRYVKTHQVVCFKYVCFLILQLHLNESANRSMKMPISAQFIFLTLGNLPVPDSTLL